MRERDDIIGRMMDATSEQINRALLGPYYTTTVAHTPQSNLTLEKFTRIYEYAKPEHVTIKGQRHEIWGYKVHEGDPLPEGVIVLTEKMKPESLELGKMIILFVNEDKAVIYDPAKHRPEPPRVELPRYERGPRFDFGLNFSPYHAAPSAYIPRAREIVKERWPELIPGADDFFEVYEVVESE